MERRLNLKMWGNPGHQGWELWVNAIRTAGRDATIRTKIERKLRKMEKYFIPTKLDFGFIISQTNQQLLFMLRAARNIQNRSLMARRLEAETFGNVSHNLTLNGKQLPEAGSYAGERGWKTSTEICKSMTELKSRSRREPPQSDGAQTTQTGPRCFPSGTRMSSIWEATCGVPLADLRSNLAAHSFFNRFYFYSFLCKSIGSTFPKVSAILRNKANGFKIEGMREKTWPTRKIWRKRVRRTFSQRTVTHPN